MSSKGSGKYAGSYEPPLLNNVDKYQNLVLAQIFNPYGKCSKISNTFLFLFSTKFLVIRAGMHKLLVRIANRGDPDQTASSEAV